MAIGLGSVPWEVMAVPLVGRVTVSLTFCLWLLTWTIALTVVCVSIGPCGMNYRRESGPLNTSLQKP